MAHSKARIEQQAGERRVVLGFKVEEAIHERARIWTRAASELASAPAGLEAQVKAACQQLGLVSAGVLELPAGKLAEFCKSCGGLEQVLRQASMEDLYPLWDHLDGRFGIHMFYCMKAGSTESASLRVKVGFEIKNFLQALERDYLARSLHRSGLWYELYRGLYRTLYRCIEIDCTLLAAGNVKAAEDLEGIRSLMAQGTPILGTLRFDSRTVVVTA